VIDAVRAATTAMAAKKRMYLKRSMELDRLALWRVLVRFEPVFSRSEGPSVMSDDTDSMDIDPVQYFIGNGASHIALTISQAELLARLKILTGDAEPPVESVEEKEREDLDALVGLAKEELESARPEEVGAEELTDLLEKILAHQQALLKTQAQVISRFSGRSPESHYEEWKETQESGAPDR
jgi:hypothetical protein